MVKLTVKLPFIFIILLVWITVDQFSLSEWCGGSLFIWPSAVGGSSVWGPEVCHLQTRNRPYPPRGGAHPEAAVCVRLWQRYSIVILSNTWKFAIPENMELIWSTFYDKLINCWILKVYKNFSSKQYYICCSWFFCLHFVTKMTAIFFHSVGYLSLLTQLTKVGDISREQFEGNWQPWWKKKMKICLDLQVIVWYERKTADRLSPSMKIL